MVAVAALAPGSIVSGLIYQGLNDLFVLGRVVTFRNWFVVAGTVVIDAALVYLVVATAGRLARALSGGPR